MSSTLIEGFAKYGLSVTFLVSLIVAGLCTAVVILWKDKKAGEEAHNAEKLQLMADREKEKEVLLRRLESVQERRVQESKERNKALVELTEDNIKVMTELVSTVSVLKDAALFKEKDK